MKANQIRKATSTMTFENAISYIQNLGLELTPSENYPFCKSWSVNNNKEIFRISCSLKDLFSDSADVKFCFY